MNCISVFAKHGLNSLGFPLTIQIENIYIKKYIQNTERFMQFMFLMLAFQNTDIYINVLTRLRHALIAKEQTPNV